MTRLSHWTLRGGGPKSGRGVAEYSEGVVMGRSAAIWGAARWREERCGGGRTAGGEVRGGEYAVRQVKNGLTGLRAMVCIEDEVAARGAAEWVVGQRAMRDLYGRGSVGEIGCAHGGEDGETAAGSH